MVWKVYNQLHHKSKVIPRHLGVRVGETALRHGDPIVPAPIFKPPPKQLDFFFGTMRVVAWIMATGVFFVVRVRIFDSKELGAP